MSVNGQNLTLSVLAFTVAVSALEYLIFGTVFWCLAAQFPVGIFWNGVGLVTVAVALALCTTDKALLRRLLPPLVLAFLFEYVLAFGTYGLLWVSQPLYEVAIRLHYPAIFLGEVVFPNSGRGTIGRDIAFAAVTEWLLIALAIYLVQGYARGQRARTAVLSSDMNVAPVKSLLILAGFVCGLWYLSGRVIGFAFFAG